MTKYQIIKNYTNWMFPQFKIRDISSSYAQNYVWGEILVVRIVPGYVHSYYFYNEFEVYIRSFFPEDSEGVMSLILSRLQNPQ